MFQIAYCPIILDHGRRLDREDTLRLQRDNRDSTRETTERDSTRNSSNRDRGSTREKKASRDLIQDPERPDKEQRES